MSNPKKQDAGASEGARRATEDAPASLATAGGGRWSSKRKLSVILELLRGADLESTSRKHRVTAATLTEWRDRFLFSPLEHFPHQMFPMHCPIKFRAGGRAASGLGRTRCLGSYSLCWNQAEEN